MSDMALDDLWDEQLRSDGVAEESELDIAPLY